MSVKIKVLAIILKKAAETRYKINLAVIAGKLGHASVSS
jgi:hypothetical protein